MRSAPTLLLAAFLPAIAPATQDELARAERLLAEKRYAAAETILREIVQSDPSNARAQGNLALALLPQGKVREAVDAGRLAAAMGPDLPEAHYIYAIALRTDGRPLEAARELERVVASKPGEPGPLLALASAYAEALDARAVAPYEKLIAIDPARPSYRSELAEYFWRSGQADHGNRVMEEALRLFPDDGELALRYGRALFEQERYLDAAESLDRSRARGALDSSASAALRGEAYWQAGRTDTAREVFEAARKKFPEDLALRRDLGGLLLSLGQPAEALPHLEAVALAQPAASEVRLDLGRAYESLGRLPEADSAYRGALKLSPSSPRAHYALGRLLLREGKKDEAARELAIHKALYERAQKLVSESHARSGELALAWSELNGGKTPQALERFEKLPESADTLLGRATALSRLRRHREAVGVLERARELDPKNPRVESLLTAERSRAEGPK